MKTTATETGAANGTSTKRAFDAATKQNWGSNGMARDERAGYRASRCVVGGEDFVAVRAADMAARNVPWTVYLDGRLSTLGAGSRYRNIARSRAANGRPLLQRAA